VKPESNPAGARIHALFALMFGLFLGLCIWKFGDPVILDHKIVPPATLPDFLNDAWPPHWVKWIWVPLAV